MVEAWSSSDGMSPIPLGRDLAAVLPIGIPMGLVSSEKDKERRFLVRRSGSYCLLDREGQELWSFAWHGLSREQLAFSLAQRWVRRTPQVLADIDEFVSRRMLLGLGGDWREDWERLDTIRAVPRGICRGKDERNSFKLITPDLRFEIVVSGIDFALWSTWDGCTTLGQAVGSVGEFTGASVSVLRRHSHALLVACVRAGAIFIDDLVIPTAGEENG